MIMATLPSVSMAQTLSGRSLAIIGAGEGIVFNNCSSSRHPLWSVSVLKAPPDLGHQRAVGDILMYSMEQGVCPPADSDVFEIRFWSRAF